MNIIEHNQAAWNRMVENGSPWTKPVNPEQIEKAKLGDWEIVLTPTKHVPKDWLSDLQGRNVLCLAGGGGQQGPILAAAGANVTVLDISEKQLEQDLFVAKRDGLSIKTVQGTMTDLSMFPNEHFDFIIHPVSNLYIKDIHTVWREAHRVLKLNGLLLSGFFNPVSFIFDFEKEEEGKLEVKYSIPYYESESLSEELLQDCIEHQYPLIHGHSLEDQLKGQMQAGFVIADMYEDSLGGKKLLDKYIPSYMATKAIKL